MTAQRRSGGRTTRTGTGRAMRPMPVRRPRNNLPLVLGLCGGGVVLVIVIVVVASGGRGAPAESSGTSNRPEPVDVSDLEREGQRRCEEGMRMVEAAEPDLRRTLSVDEQRGLKTRLKRAKELLREGIGFYEKAMMKGGEKYDVKRYQETQKYIGGRILELPD